MKAVAPSYYPLFKCIAGACRHTCCAMWEVDIDPATYDKYLNMRGPFAERIRSSVAVEDDGSETGEAHFVLRPDGRCPMLRDDGLCDLILECGESSLCRVCDEHPRFFNFRSDRVECGLGLSCEAALDLILNWDKGFELTDVTSMSPASHDIDLDMVPEEEPDELETEVYQARDNAIKIALSRGMRLSERVMKVAGDLWTPAERLEVLKSLESLSSEWCGIYNRIEASPDNTKSFEVIDGDRYALQFLNLFIYFLYRYPWEGGRLAGELLLMTADCVAANPGTDIRDIVRELSSNVEYSDCNIDDIMSRI
ncbi:hypothetical protein SAMN02910456_02358 [Ruminococcaceae bacterium YRB3002]|nr:hypothetical protein SAMN02910456_02358 [Ruminococcaceae bacterium YRB3002]